MTVTGFGGPGHKIETMDLVVFTTVTRMGSLGAAASELRLSMPSVSVRIAALERKLGPALFVRGPRGSVTTPAGERLNDYAQRCLDLLDEAAIGVAKHETQRLLLPPPPRPRAPAFPPPPRGGAGRSTSPSGSSSPRPRASATSSSPPCCGRSQANRLPCTAGSHTAVRSSAAWSTVASTPDS